MKSVYSAKFLTFLYFSIVAVAIVIIHISVFWNTTEDLEHLYGENRLEQIRAYTNQLLASEDVTGRASIEILTQGNTEFDRGTQVVFDFTLLPGWLPNPDSLPYDKGTEAISKDHDEAYFLMKTKISTATGAKDAVLLMDFRLYELSENQLFTSHVKQVAISLLLLIVSLLVVIRISDRLTRPISSFANSVASKSTEDLNPVPLPAGTNTRELVEMVETFNRYQEQIKSLIERERSFNRYASHELRTPLTVMKGALTLMEESDEPEFTRVQQLRLNAAIQEMSELIETLLNLTRSTESSETKPRKLSEAEISGIARDHEHLLAGKDQAWRVSILGKPEINMPESTFRILLGNLVKNSFTYAERGEVLIEAFPGGIRVVDTGANHTDGEYIKEGFGLGLLLVKDICRRFGWHTEHDGNDSGGWTTTITFKETP